MCYMSLAYAAGRRRAIAGGRRQMEAEEDGAGPSAMVYIAISIAVFPVSIYLARGIITLHYYIITPQ